LGAIFGREESRRALGETHAQVFQQWLNLPLALKRDDVLEYLSTVDPPASDFVDYWKKSGLAKSYFPAAANEAEKQLFVREFAILVEILGC
jgi:hypothetical protein